MVPGSTPEELKRAYRRKAMQFHPDHNKSVTAQYDFYLIQQAYESLMAYSRNPQAPPLHAATVYPSPPADSKYAKAREFEQRYKEKVRTHAGHSRRKQDPERKLNKLNLFFAILFLLVAVLNFVFLKNGWLAVPSIALLYRSFYLIVLEWDYLRLK